MYYQLLRQELACEDYDRIKMLISQQGTLSDFVEILVQEDNIDFIVKLVELGYDINGIYYSFSLLTLAVESGNIDMVKRFVSIGADPNLAWDDFSGGIDFALNEAANQKNKEIFDYLSPLTTPELRKIAEMNWNPPDS
jgi:ankyrin repeat protein